MQMAVWRRVLIIAAFVTVVFALLLCFAAGSNAALGLEVSGDARTPGPGAASTAEEELSGEPDPIQDRPRLEPTPTPDPDQYEPDDVKHQASQITMGAPQRHNFQRKDEDWVKFWAWAGHTYTIETFQLDMGCDTVLCLYDDVGTQIQCDDNAGEEDLASWMEWIPEQSGIYFVKAAQREPYVYGNLHYSLIINEVLNCRDSFEPDDTPANAKPLAEEPHTFHGPCGGDEDWAWFKPEGGQIYAIWTSDLGESNDTVLALYETDSLTDTDAITLTVNDDHAETLPASRIVWQAPMDADGSIALVRVSPFGLGAGGCDVGYVLHLDTLPAMPTPTPTPPPPAYDPDQYEPDDAMHQASEIEVNSEQPQEHAFHAYEDCDWVKFWAWAGYAYTIKTEVGPGANTTLQLRDAEGDVLEKNNNDPQNPPASRIDWTAPKTGSYFVRVSTPYTDDVQLRGLTSPYGLTYALAVSETVDCIDDYEPDATPGQAKPIVMDEAPQRHCFCVPCFDHNHPPDAADWVSFEAQRGTTYEFRTFGLTRGTDTVLELHGLDDDVLDVNDDYRDDSLGSSIIWQAYRSGTYKVKVSPSDPRMGGCDAFYSLTVDLVPSLAYLPLVVRPLRCPDEHEPDNDLIQSKNWPPLQSGQAVPGYICQQHVHLTDSDPVERDWYWFDIGKLREIEVDLEVPDGVNYDLYLWVGHWEGSENPTPGADEYISWSAERIGTYYVVVKSNGDHDNWNPYIVRMILR